MCNFKKNPNIVQSSSIAVPEWINAVWPGQTCSINTRFMQRRINCVPYFCLPAAFIKCKSKFGVPDVFINCAGICGEQHWEKLYDINIVRSRRKHNATHVDIPINSKYLDYFSFSERNSLVYWAMLQTHVQDGGGWEGRRHCHSFQYLRPHLCGWHVRHACLHRQQTRRLCTHENLGGKRLSLSQKMISYTIGKLKIPHFSARLPL